MTEQEFRSDLTIIESEVERAIESFFTYDEIGSLASNNEEILKKLNANAPFWYTVLYALQCSFYISLGRVFDDNPDAHSIHKVVNACIAHPQFFSKETLTKRKMQSSESQNKHEKREPAWLKEYIAKAFEPRTQDLRELRRALKKSRATYDAVCRDIRNKVFAHRERIDVETISDLFSQSEVSEIKQILYSLHDLVSAIWEMYNNGRKPDLGKKQYDYANRISTATNRLIDSIQ
ncbi:MAG: hypothetical protein AABO41_02910 [Acidobacteriota bacterium]